MVLMWNMWRLTASELKIWGPMVSKNRRWMKEEKIEERMSQWKEITTIVPYALFKDRSSFCIYRGYLDSSIQDYTTLYRLSSGETLEQVFVIEAWPRNKKTSSCSNIEF